MHLGQPHANLAIAGHAMGFLEFFLQRGQGGVCHTTVDRWSRPLVVERLGQPTCGIGPKPRGDTMAMHPEQTGDLVAVPGLTARHKIECMEALPFLVVCFVFHALV
jgi:hypothetical protein